MKKLRKKIILGVFASATVVFALTVLIVSVALNIQQARRADTVTELLIGVNGVLPEENPYANLNEPAQTTIRSLDIELPYRLRYFSVHRSSDGSVTCELSHIASIDNEAALKMTSTVLTNNREVGYLNDFRYRISDDRSLIVFIDYSTELASIEMLTIVLSSVALFFDIMITMVFCFFSKRIVQPFETNAQMQKQFITDASHELKTPLAIISANAEVLAYKDGENEWINNITTQVTRVSEMVNDLLTLNRLEEIDEMTDIAPVNFSDTVNGVADSFEEVFARKNVKISRSIQPDVVLNGNAAQLERLVSVLVENASKYAAEGGEMRILLKKDMRHTLLTVFNTCEIDKSVDYSHLFDRFYRPDSSRTSKTGGHGIGLSIAKRITMLHNGNIAAVPAEDGLAFHVSLSNRLKARNKNG